LQLPKLFRCQGERCFAQPGQFRAIAARFDKFVGPYRSGVLSVASASGFVNSRYDQKNYSGTPTVEQDTVFCFWT
jgi:hypothetical protein